MFDGLKVFSRTAQLYCIPMRFGRRRPFPCEADDGDLCETDDGKLATARSRTPQLPPHFSEASLAVITFFFLAASLLKVKELQPSPSKLVVRDEADGSDLCETVGGYLVTAISSNFTAVFPNATASTKLYSKASPIASRFFFLLRPC